MLYNKNNVRKTNDKKILHKVGKQWKVVSVALLMAIGGGAVATHVANAQSNNGETAATAAEVSALDQKPAVASAQSVAPSSAAKSASAAKPVSNVSYLSGDNGSAAMYNAKALNDRYAAQSNGAIVNRYVKSLNAKFPTATKMMNDKAASASADAKSDANLANSYSAVANDKANSSAVNSLASKAGYTANDYANFVVKPQANVYSGEVKSASDVANAINLVSGLAENYMLNSGSLSGLSNEASNAAMNASVNATIAGIQQGFNASASASTTAAESNNDASLQNAIVSSAYASADNRVQIAKANSLNAASASSVVAKYAKNNSAAVASAVSSYASVSNSSNSNAYGTVVVANYSEESSKGETKPVKVGSSLANNYTSASAFNLSGVSALTSSANSSAYSAMNQLVSNAYALNADASLTAKDNSVIASANAAKASLSNASASYTVASNNASKAMINVNATADAANLANSAFTSVSAMGSNLASDMVSALAGGKASVESALGIEGINSLGSAEAPLVKADLVSMASANGIDVNVLKSNASAVKALASTVQTDAKGNYSVSNLSSVAGSLAKSATSALTSANSASASFAGSTDEDVTLASYFASSYSVNASSNASLASSYANDANAFYTANADASFASANNALKTAKAAEPNDAALAKAFGNRVFNYAPKYLTVLKPVALYHVANSKFTRVVNVPVGTRLTVTGVQFMQNGSVRYQTSYKGKQGTVNSYKSYVQQTYLPTANGVDVTVVKPSKVYASVSKNGFGKVAAKTLPAGAKLSNVNIVSADGVYGGFTAVETQSGKFVSANIAYAEVNNANANDNQTNNGSANNSNHVSFWA